MMHPYGVEHYPPDEYQLFQDAQDVEQIEDFDDMQYFDSIGYSSPSPAPRNNNSHRVYERDFMDEDDDVTQFEEQIRRQTPSTPLNPYPSRNTSHADIGAVSHTVHPSLQRLDSGTLVRGAYMHPSQTTHFPQPIYTLSQPIGPTPPEQGPNPRNSHGIPLKPVSALPDIYRGFFKFGVFNAIQSRCYDTILNFPDNMVISAPTGSGKTVLFELALIRLLMERTTGDSKCVYMAPTKALCSERYRDWSAKLDPIGIKCCELTGDTVGFGRNAWGDAKNSSVIITTPEKFDSLSRNWRDHCDILSKTRLFLIDEVHILNETRGSTLEVVTSRMKTRGTSVRFILVSATVPNIDDIAAWIENGTTGGPAIVHNFGDEFRPCKLTRVVYGYPQKNHNDFSFSRMLDYKVLSLLQQHAANKPVLIFCATRKGVVGTAEVLMKEYQKLQSEGQTVPWEQPRKIDVIFHDNSLLELAKSGIGIHHAGLMLDDRRSTEDLFLKKIIRVVVATSTLAVGVNLPAHTVIVKGVKQWMNGGWQEYSDLDFIQMIGRAGRPQFDKEGVAIIMCDSEQERKYKALVSGKTFLESCLHVNLAEHLNSEISLGTITDLITAKAWLHNSFLFQRIQKNPQHYALGKKSDQTWESRLDELVESSIRALQDNELVTNNGINADFASTEYGEIMSKYYIRLLTMELILKLPDKCTLREILELISSAEEIDLRLRAGEKQVYKRIADHNDIRFRSKIEKASDKVFILMQAVLGGISLSSPEFKTADSQPFLEALTVFKHAARIARAIVEVGIAKKSGAVLKHGMELVRSLNAKAWEDRPVVLRQIEQIGEKSIKVLAQNGITTLTALRKQTPARIEILLNRRPPFGNTVLAAVRDLPQFSLKITEVSVSSSRGRKPVIAELNIECGLLGIAETQSKAAKGKKIKSMSLGMTGLLTLTSDNDFVDFRRIPTKALRDPKSFLVSVKLTKPSQTVSTHISPDNFAGLTVIETYKPSIHPGEYPTLDTRPASYDVDVILAGLEEDPTFWDMTEEDMPRDKPSQGWGIDSPPPVKHDNKTQTKQSPKIQTVLDNQSNNPAQSFLDPLKLPNGNYQCLHSCKDKTKCRHFCCRDGVSKPPRKPSQHPSNTLRPQAPAAELASNAKDSTSKRTFNHVIRPEDVSKTGYKSQRSSMSDRGLKHLESLHQKSGGLELSDGRRLKLDAEPASSRRKRENRDWDTELTFANLDDNLKRKFDKDDLPHPHEILAKPAVKAKRDPPSEESNYTDADLDMAMANVPLSLLDGDCYASSKSKGPNAVFASFSTTKDSISSAVGPGCPPRSTIRGLPPPLSPVSKRPRLETHLSKPTVINPGDMSKKSSSESEPSLVPFISKPLPTKADFTTDRQKGESLFLKGAFSSDERTILYDDEPFAFDPHTFDLESTPSFGPAAVKRTEEPTAHFEVDEQRTTVSTMKNSTSETDVAIADETQVPRDEEAGTRQTASNYDQGLAEFDAWFYSGAVEITDGP